MLNRSTRRSRLQAWAWALALTLVLALTGLLYELDRLPYLPLLPTQDGFDYDGGVEPYIPLLGVAEDEPLDNFEKPAEGDNEPPQPALALEAAGSDDDYIFSPPYTPPGWPEYTRMTSNISHFWRSPAYYLPEESNDWPVPRMQTQENSYDVYKQWNEWSLLEYRACLQAGNKCPMRQRKIVLCSSPWFDEAVIRRWRGGEGVWALSMFKALRELGYTTFFSIHREETIEQYKMYPNAVVAIIDRYNYECRDMPGCIKTEENPDGIPAWKYRLDLQRDIDFRFDMSFFPGERSKDEQMLIGPWCINADFDHEPGTETGHNATYLGYSVEQDCGRVELVPTEKRRNAAWFLAKVITYAYRLDAPWDISYWQKAKDELSLGGLTFRGSYIKETTYQWTPEIGEMAPIDAIDDVPKLGPAEFLREIAGDVAVVGMSQPYMSPSPYVSLCMGTPFINPIQYWWEGNPKDRNAWHAQQPRLRWMDPPYVYNVFNHDYEGFVLALESAKKNPIGEKYIVPEMTLDAVQGRMQKFLEETDWRAIAVKQRDERVRNGEDLVWIL